MTYDEYMKQLEDYRQGVSSGNTWGIPTYPNPEEVDYKTIPVSSQTVFGNIGFGPTGSYYSQVYAPRDVILNDPTYDNSYFGATHQAAVAFPNYNPYDQYTDLLGRDLTTVYDYGSKIQDDEIESMKKIYQNQVDALKEKGQFFDWEGSYANSELPYSQWDYEQRMGARDYAAGYTNMDVYGGGLVEHLRGKETEKYGWMESPDAWQDRISTQGTLEDLYFKEQEEAKVAAWEQMKRDKEAELNPSQGSY